MYGLELNVSDKIFRVSFFYTTVSKHSDKVFVSIVFFSSLAIIHLIFFLHLLVNFYFIIVLLILVLLVYCSSENLTAHRSTASKSIGLAWIAFS